MDALSDLKDLTPGQLERAQSLAREGYTPAQIELFLKAEWRVAQSLLLPTLPDMGQMTNSEQKLARQWLQGSMTAFDVAAKIRQRRLDHRTQEAVWAAANPSKVRRRRE
jgi:hypothetical protein